MLENALSDVGTRITVRVQPNAKRNEIIGLELGVLRLKIAATPVDGKANKELVDFLSKVLGVSKSHITIEKGHTAKVKVLNIRGLSELSVRKLLSGQLH